MVTASIRNECFNAFLKGFSLRAIAAKHGVGRRTLERWSASEHWSLRRERAWNEAKGKIAQNHVSGVAHIDINASEGIMDLLLLAYSERRAFYEGKIPRKALRFSSREFIHLAKAFHFANIADRFSALGIEIRTEVKNGTFDPENYSKRHV